MACAIALINSKAEQLKRGWIPPPYHLSSREKALVTSAMKKSANKSKESSSGGGGLGGFLRGSFLRSSVASKSVTSSSSPQKKKQSPNKKSAPKSTSSNDRPGRERTPRTSTTSNCNSRQSPSRAKSADTRPKLTTNSSSRSNSKSDPRLLRSVSPSRRRIQEFMQDLNRKERSVSRDKRKMMSGSSMPDLKQSSSQSKLSTRRSVSRERTRLPSVERLASRSMDGGRASVSSQSPKDSQNRLSPRETKIPASAKKQQQQRRQSDPIKNAPSNTLRKQRSSFEDEDVKTSPKASGVIEDGAGRSLQSSSAAKPRGRISQSSVHVSPGSASRKTPISKRSSGSSLGSRNKSQSPNSSMVHPSTNPEDFEAWTSAIARRDWTLVDQLVGSYDFKKYRPNESSENARKPQKKLRVFKYLPHNKDAATSNNREEEDEDGEGEMIPPLLQTDSTGRTVLHLACKEYMPWKLVQSLFFLERRAASVCDNDGRLPLHLALISNHEPKILDRLIHAYPSGLNQPDGLSRTPLAYAILRAEHKRDKSVRATWRTPLAKEEQDWQTQQTEHWVNAQFVLDALVSRRKLLSKVHETSLLIQAADAYAPPTTILAMLSVSARILQQDQALAVQLFQLLISRDYSISIIQKALKICAETMPQLALKTCIGRGMVEHYDQGCINRFREEFLLEFSFRTEIFQAYKRQQMENTEKVILTAAGQEWWDKLKFLIGYSSSGTLKAHTLDESYLLHSALMVPDTPPDLLELLIRLFPQARYEADPTTDAMPIHLACMHWRGSGQQKGGDMAVSQILNLLVAGDFALARKRWHKRYPLQLAVLAGQNLSFVRTIVAFSAKVTNSVDSWTRLYPFQLAAMDKTSLTSEAQGQSARMEVIGNDDGQLDVVYELLRANPPAVYPILSCGSGDPMFDMGFVAQHVLSWCYTYHHKDWQLDRPRLEQLRSAISRGQILDSMTCWFATLKSFIWKVYDRNNAGKRIVYMPHEDIFLLHAALSNGRTPPIAIELLLELYPKAIQTPIPGTQEYPIHIAARSPSYTPMPFETVISITSVLEMIVLAYPQATTVDLDGRNALQLAIDSGKTWHEIRPILQANPALLKVLDPSSRLPPFQHMASAESFMPLSEWMKIKTFALKWTDRSASENGLLIRRFQREYQQEKLSAIFEMLRIHPEALSAFNTKEEHERATFFLQGRVEML